MRRKVLLVDDSLSIQKMFGLYLEKCAIDVVTMSNGELAVSRLSSIRPDLILADVFMPGHNGYEVCEYVKQHPDFKHIPVLLLTGKFEPYDEKEAKRVKADGHIVKPIAEQEFISLIRTTLERFPPRPAVTPSLTPSPTITQPAEKTQLLGSSDPAATSKKPSGLGAAQPKFHLGSLDPSSEVPPPTIKVTPSMLASMTSSPGMDDGRLPDLELLLPLDTPPAASSDTDTTDFILDLPPPEQAPPLLTYPEPPKTLSTPISRPTFSSLPPPNIGTTTAKLDPSELPELLTAAAVSSPPARQAPPVPESDSPLELDDIAPPATSLVVLPEPEVAKVATSPAEVLDEVAAPFVVPPFTPPPATSIPHTAGIPVAETSVAVFPEQAPSIAVPVETPAATVLPDAPPIPPFEPVITQPTQITQPWEQSTSTEPPTTVAFHVQPATSSLPPTTAPLATQPTGSLLTEPVPPPDFLAGLVSPPIAPESASAVGAPPMTLVEDSAPSSTSEQTDATPESTAALVSFSTLPTSAPPSAPVFEVVMEEESPVRGTDLLPDELVATRQLSPAAGTTPSIETTSEAPASMETDAAVDLRRTVEATDRADEQLSISTEVTSPVPVATTDTTTDTVATGQIEFPAPEETTHRVTNDIAPPLETPVIPDFVPKPLETPPLEVGGFSPPSVAEAEVIEPGVPTRTDESVMAAEVSPTLPTTLPETTVQPPVAAASLAASEVPPAEAYSSEPQPETEVQAGLVASPAVSAVEPTLITTPMQTVDWSTFTLPPAVMEEIVRRVVAEISDHVVREIAWEVVPDLAELLIKKHLANRNGRHNTDG
ncbi:MAG: response regulator [Acidobacteriota bacterium]